MGRPLGKTVTELFLSYSREDIAFTRRLVGALSDLGRDIWVDLDDLYAGEEYWPKICSAIEAANAFVFVVSPGSICSEYCLRELAHAVQHNKRILPLITREVLAETMPRPLASRQWIFGREADDFGHGVQALITAIDTDPEWVREHSRLLVRAREWEESNRERSLVLRGSHLERGEQWLAQAGAHPDPAPTPLQGEYILASRKAAVQQQRMLLASVSFGLVLALGLALMAWIQRGEARRQRDVARSRELAVSAISRLASEPELGILLGKEAVNVKRTPEADYALRRAVGALLETGLRSILRGHTGKLTDISFSHDGRLVLTASEDKTGRVWNAAAGQTVSLLRGHSKGLTSAEFSPDGKRVVTASADKTARVWNVTTGEAICILSGHTEPVTSVAFSPDQSRIVTASMDKTARVWDGASCKPILELRGHEGPVYSAVFGDMGSVIITASADKTSRIWVAYDGRAILTVPTSGLVLRAKSSPDGKVTLISGLDGAYLVAPFGAFRLRPTMASVDMLGLLKDPWKQIIPYSVDANFSPDGRFAVTTFSDRTARVWQVPALASFKGLQQGRQAAILRGHTDDLVSAVFSPDGNQVLTGSADGSAKIWDLKTQSAIKELRGSSGPLTKAVFSPDGKWVLTANSDSVARIWEVSGVEGLINIPDSTDEGGVFSPDGKRVAVLGNGNVMYVYDVAAGTRKASFTGHTDKIKAAAFSPDGAFIITASVDKTARVWKAATGELRAELRGHRNAVLSASFSPDGKRILTASGRPGELVSSEGNDTARIWEANSGRTLVELRGHTDAILVAKFSPNGNMVVTGSADKSARIWDANTGRCLAVLQGHEGPVHTAAFSPDGNAIVTADHDSSPRVWKSDSGTLLVTLTGHTAAAGKAIFGPDSHQIVTAGADHTARVWEVGIDRNPIVLIGHKDVVTDVVFSPDGLLVATSSLDGTARLWDAPSGQPLFTLPLANPARSVTFGPNGKSLLIVSGFQTFLYRCEMCGSVEDVLKAASDRVRRDLTIFEREQYLHESLGNSPTSSSRYIGVKAGDLKHMNAVPANPAQDSKQVDVQLLPRESKERKREEREVLRRFLDDRINAARNLMLGFKFDQAAQVLETAVKRIDRTRYAEWWAEMQSHWGLALSGLGASGEGGQGSASLRAAVTAFQNALRVRRKESLPQEWAATQNNLGNAYQSLGERLKGTEAIESLRDAVTAYQRTLQVQTKKSFPWYWARTQSDLGVVYRSLGERLNGIESIENLRNAVTACQNALEVRTKKSMPQEWAATQNNLGNAYKSLGERLKDTEAIESLRDAVTAYQIALEVRTKESLPQEWAETQHGLGTAYESLGKRLSGTEAVESLRAVVTAYQNTLEIFTKESFPQGWGEIQNNLGIAYAGLGEWLTGAEAVESLRAAVTAYQSALQVRTKESLPQEWAATQNNLGNAYQSLGERLKGTEATESLSDALHAYQNALQVRTKESIPQAWARTENDLAGVLLLQERWEEAAQTAENVLTLYPTDRVALKLAADTYHEHLFRFDRAFALTAKLVELGERELDFIEAHLTTGRFDDCVNRAAALQNKISRKDHRLVLAGLRLACSSAAQKNDDVWAVGSQLREEISGLEKVRWIFGGTKHFVDQHAAFAAKATAWVRLFEALEEGDKTKAHAALTALGVSE
jgi:WD40 repeat protein/tetratricopeptide (TPR) repeat protein